jgi:hypothetical protein
MTAFHEGQEVEVWCFPDGEWEKAKILGDRPFGLPGYWIQFPDGTRAVFDAEHIRALLTGVYGAMCRDPHFCHDKGYCPRDPTCAD